MTSRVAGLALIAAAVCGCGKSAEERAQEAKRAEADRYNAELERQKSGAKWTPVAPPAPAKLAIDPVVIGAGETADADARRIAAIVIERCLARAEGFQQRDAWPAVTKITVKKSSIFTKGKDVPVWNLDLAVDAARFPDMLHGNTALLYQVQEQVSTMTIRALKDEAAGMCGFERSDEFVPLR